MGYATILDIIGSTIIGGFLLLILFRLNASATENTYNYGSSLNAQQSLTLISKVIDYDFSKIGYVNGQAPDYDGAIKLADSTHFEFYADMNNDGKIDSVSYLLGPASDLSNTPNPSDRMLYRTVNYTIPPEVTKITGVTIFRLNYFDASNHLMSFPITHPENIVRVQVLLKTENAEPMNGQFASAFLQKTEYIGYNITER